MEIMIKYPMRINIEVWRGGHWGESEGETERERERNTFSNIIVNTK